MAEPKTKTTQPKPDTKEPTQPDRFADIKAFPLEAGESAAFKVLEGAPTHVCGKRVQPGNTITLTASQAYDPWMNGEIGEAAKSAKEAA